MVASTGIIPGKEEMIRPTNRNSSVPEEVFFFSMISILGLYDFNIFQQQRGS
jgi:hypothetical protein